MGVTRRRFLRAGAAGLLASATAPLWLRLAPASAAGPDAPPAPASADAPLLVVLFLRGGADALHLAPPVGDREYARLRGRLALERTLPFGGGFGLHPRLEALQPLVDAGRLAVVPAAGSPHPTRSHFEAQDRMELGDRLGDGASRGEPRRRDGWLARALRGVATGSPFEALALADRLPLALRGSDGLVVDGSGLGLAGVRSEVRSALERRYAEASDPLLAAGRRALAALAGYERVMGNREGRREVRERRGRGPVALAPAVEQVLRLEAGGLPLRAVWLESGDWDTHASQGVEDGRMARAIEDLGLALARLETGLRGRRDWTAVAMTEFGRTVRPNGSAGTDHGHGALMLVAGTRVRGGLRGDWPGLAESRLHEGRDLPVATDYRSVLAEVLCAHLGGPLPRDTFPDFDPSPLGLLASA
jgi:uncharacterized protein (DUF1501 family)